MTLELSGLLSSRCLDLDPVYGARPLKRLIQQSRIDRKLDYCR